LRKTFLRYLAAGGVNTAVTYAAYLLLLRVMPYEWAYTIVFVAGIVLAYALQSRLVFEVGAAWRTFLKFPLAYLVQYAVGRIAMHLVVERGWLSERAALLVALCLTVPLGFVLSRYVFRARP